MYKEKHAKGNYVSSHGLTTHALDWLRESFSALVNIKSRIWKTLINVHSPYWLSERHDFQGPLAVFNYSILSL